MHNPICEARGKEGYQSAIVRSPESDVFFILLYYAHELEITIYLDTGSGKHRRMINITEKAHSLGIGSTPTQ